LANKRKTYTRAADEHTDAKPFFLSCPLFVFDYALCVYEMQIRIPDRFISRSYNTLRSGKGTGYNMNIRSGVYNKKLSGETNCNKKASTACPIPFLPVQQPPDVRSISLWPEK
jgi:hypothetical protein